MNKRLILICFTLCSIVLLFFFYSNNFYDFRSNAKEVTLLKENSNQETPSIQKTTPTHEINLYNTYYSLKIKNLLDLDLNGREKAELSAIKAPFEKEIKMYKSQTSIYDVWLYTKSVILVNGILLDYDTTSSFLNQFRADNGFFYDQPSHSRVDDSKVSLVETILACEILEAYKDICSVNKEVLVSNFYDLQKKPNEFNLISYGDNLVMLNTIFKKYTNESTSIDAELESLNPNICSNIIIKQNELFLLEYTVIKDLNDICNLEQINIFQFKEKALNAQLDDGTWPIYGEYGESSDMLTTYLILDLLIYYNIEIPNKNKLEILFRN